MNKELTTDECIEIFEKYDQELYRYYINNMYFFGCDARRYAEYLKRTKKKKNNRDINKRSSF